MIRRTNDEIKQNIKQEYGAMHQSGCSYLTISRALMGKYNPRLIIEGIQEYNDSRMKIA